MRIVLVLIGALLVGAYAPPSSCANTARQDASLPADILFVTALEPDSGPFSRDNLIVRIDAATETATPFYADPGALHLVPLRWSPQADRLLFYRTTHPAEKELAAQLCILAKNGTLQGCLEDSPPVQGYYVEPPLATWSADGQKVYFLREQTNPSGECIRALTEADATTGRTLRTLYETDCFTELVWSPSSETAIVGTGDHWRTRYEHRTPTHILDLQTGHTLFDLDTLVPEHAHPFSVSPQISPDGAYLIASVFYDLRYDNPYGIHAQGALPLRFLVDRRGRIHAVFGEPNGLPRMDVFGWGRDGQTLYFGHMENTLDCSGFGMEGRWRFYRYDIATGKLTPLYTDTACTIVTIRNTLRPSPDETALLFEFQPSGSRFGNMWHIALVSTEGAGLHFLTPAYPSVQYPIWSPPSP